MPPVKVEEAQALKPGRTYLYQYKVSIGSHGSKAQYKGQIQGFIRSGESGYEFLAPNDETAYSYLLEEFKPDDSRPLQSARVLAESHFRVWDTNDPQLPDLPVAGQPRTQPGRSGVLNDLSGARSSCPRSVCWSF